MILRCLLCGGSVEVPDEVIDAIEDNDPDIDVDNLQAFCQTCTHPTEH